MGIATEIGSKGASFVKGLFSWGAKAGEKAATEVAKDAAKTTKSLGQKIWTGTKWVAVTGTAVGAVHTKFKHDGLVVGAARELVLGGGGEFRVEKAKEPSQDGKDWNLVWNHSGNVSERFATEAEANAEMSRRHAEKSLLGKATSALKEPVVEVAKASFDSLMAEIKENPGTTLIAGALVAMGAGGLLGTLVSFVPWLGRIGDKLSKLCDNKFTSGIGWVMIAASAASFFGYTPDKLMAAFKPKSPDSSPALAKATEQPVLGKEPQLAKGKEHEVTATPNTKQKHQVTLLSTTPTDLGSSKSSLALPLGVIGTQVAVSKVMKSAIGSTAVGAGISAFVEAGKELHTSGSLSKAASAASSDVASSAKWAAGTTIIAKNLKLAARAGGVVGLGVAGGTLATRYLTSTGREAAAMDNEIAADLAPRVTGGIMDSNGVLTTKSYPHLDLYSGKIVTDELKQLRSQYPSGIPEHIREQVLAMSSDPKTLEANISSEITKLQKASEQEHASKGLWDKSVNWLSGITVGNNVTMSNTDRKLEVAKSALVELKHYNECHNQLSQELDEPNRESETLPAATTQSDAMQKATGQKAVSPARKDWAASTSSIKNVPQTPALGF